MAKVSRQRTSAGRWTSCSGFGSSISQFYFGEASTGRNPLEIQGDFSGEGTSQGLYCIMHARGTMVGQILGLRREESELTESW